MLITICGEIVWLSDFKNLKKSEEMIFSFLFVKRPQWFYDFDSMQ